MNVFERYAPFIRDYIYRSGWQSLRAVQNAAGDANVFVLILRLFR